MKSIINNKQTLNIFSRFHYFFIILTDSNSTVLSGAQKTPQQQTATPFLLRKTVSKFEFTQYLAQLGYLSHRPSGLDEDPFRFVHSKVAAFNRFTFSANMYILSWGSIQTSI